MAFGCLAPFFPRGEGRMDDWRRNTDVHEKWNQGVLAIGRRLSWKVERFDTYVMVVICDTY